MKTQKNWRKVGLVVLGLMAAGFMALLAGCPSPLESSGTTDGDPPVMAAGQGVVRVSLGGVNTARTLMPGDPDFTKYTLVFTPSGTWAVPPAAVDPVDVDPVTGGVIEVALEAGDWTLAVTGYTTHTVTTAEEYKAAFGEEPFTLLAGQLQTVDVTIDPITSTMTVLWIEGNKGIFKYDISYPTSDVSGTISLVTVTGPGSGTITLPNSGALAAGGSTTGSIALAPGTYDLAVILRKVVGSADDVHKPLAGTYTAVHIYPGLVTEATGPAFTFINDDFVDAVYLAGTVELTVPGDSTTLQVKEVTVRAYKVEPLVIANQIGEVATIPNPIVTPGTPTIPGTPSTPHTASIPWFLSIPFSATQGEFWLAVTVTDGNDHSFTKVFLQTANSVERKGDGNLTLTPLTINLAGVTVDFSDVPDDETIELTDANTLYWRDNTPLEITVTVPTGFTVGSWYLDGAVIGATGSPLNKTARDFSPGKHTISAKVTKDAGGMAYSKTVSFKVEAEDELPLLGMVRIPGATVTGSGTEGVFVDGRMVPVASFAMAKYETTYELWYEVREWAAAHGYIFANQGREGNDGIIGATPTTAKNEPVTQVRWQDVIVWCNAYSEKTGRVPVYTSSGGAVIRDSSDTTADNAEMDKGKSGFRLPTEVEWEFAARGGDPDTTNWGYLYAGSDTVEDVAWYSVNAGNTTHPVEEKAANSLGLYDMSGNVQEWCWDWYESVSGSTLLDGPISGSYRLLRGGKWDFGANSVKVSYRNVDTPSYTDGGIGFRVVCPSS